MRKRIADWMEKMSVAAFAVGIFQYNLVGVSIGIVALGASLWLTKQMEV